MRFNVGLKFISVNKLVHILYEIIRKIDLGEICLHLIFSVFPNVVEGGKLFKVQRVSWEMLG